MSFYTHSKFRVNFLDPSYVSAEDDIIVQFAIWERGDIALDQFTSQLKLTLRHALCDLLTEYYLLTAPLSKVPQVYHKTLMTRPRSCSEPSSPSGLTPKGPKVGSYSEASERSSKRQLDFGSQSGFRSRTASLGGQRPTPSTGSTPSSESTGRLLSMVPPIGARVFCLYLKGFGQGDFVVLFCR